jgi:hypothetical protein
MFEGSKTLAQQMLQPNLQSAHPTATATPIFITILSGCVCAREGNDKNF